MSQGLLERPVGRWHELRLVVDGCGRKRPKREGQVSVCVLLLWDRGTGLAEVSSVTVMVLSPAES